MRGWMPMHATSQAWMPMGMAYADAAPASSSGVGNAADCIVDAVGMRRSRFVFGLHGSNAGTNRRKEKRCVAEAI